MPRRIALALALVAAPMDVAGQAAQGIEYTIEARLDEGPDVLTGRAELRYTNRAPEALDTLWFHQHLNAFRPNSAWAQREVAQGNRRFQDIGADDHGFERFLGIQVDGRRVEPVYPLAPDSTVVGIPLDAPLETGATVIVRMDWQARLSTTPRRQGRGGRHFDWAHWYPRIAVYEEGVWKLQALLPEGEFYGEFGRYDVTLEVAADQVIGATGVPVAGDPGWSYPGGRPIGTTADSPNGLGLLTGSPAEGRKRVQWTADPVHHFAWSADPTFQHEIDFIARGDGAGDSIAIHALFRPVDTDWGNGSVVRRTAAALEWLQELFGPYPWPQLTALRRLESGGTEFPMLMMNGSASDGIIVHETIHQYLHGILANNEFAEGWLDEGFTSFLENWYFEEHGAPGRWTESMRILLSYEAAGEIQPIGLAAADYRSRSVFSAMTYTKPELVLRMLRWMIGETAMRDALRRYYEAHRLAHVTEADLRQVVTEAAGEDLGWFFDQWIHTTGQLDYRVASAEVEPREDGRWETRVEIVREGDIWMPVDLRVGDVEQRLTSRERRQTVSVLTTERPTEVSLDPERILIDIDPSNNEMVVSGYLGDPGNLPIPALPRRPRARG